MKNKTKYRRWAEITKISDNHFGGNHPNGINKGYTHLGWSFKPPKVGERFYIGTFSTSIVRKIVNETTFLTTYSTYKIKYPTK